MKKDRQRDEIERRMQPQNGDDDAKEEQGSAAKEIQDDRADEDQDPEEEGSAGRPQR